MSAASNSTCGRSAATSVTSATRRSSARPGTSSCADSSCPPGEAIAVPDRAVPATCTCPSSAPRWRPTSPRMSLPQARMRIRRWPEVTRDRHRNSTERGTTSGSSATGIHNLGATRAPQAHELPARSRALYACNRWSPAASGSPRRTPTGPRGQVVQFSVSQPPVAEGGPSCRWSGVEPVSGSSRKESERPDQ
jgi:hypothetical protein